MADRQELELRRKLAAGVSEREELLIRRQLSQTGRPQRLQQQLQQREQEAQELERFKFTPPVEGIGRFTPGGNLLNFATSPGLGRGFKDFAEGVEQLGLDAGTRSDFMPNPNFGPGQPRFIPITPEETERRIQAADEFTQRANRERAEFEQSSGGQFTGERFAGNVLPGFAIPGSQGSFPLRVAAGTATGAGFGATAFTPEEDIESRSEQRKENVKFGAELGAGIPSFFKAVVAARNIPKHFVRSKLTTQVAKEGAKLSERTGVEFTLGQQSGSKFLNAVEDAAKRGPFAADNIVRQENKQLASAARFLIRSMRKIHPNKVTPEVVGRSVENNFKRVIGIATNRRRLVANFDYGKLEAAGKGKKIIDVNNLRGALTELSENITPGAETLLKRSRTALNTLAKTAKDGKVTVKQVLAFRKDYSAAAAGKKNLFGDIDIAERKFIAGKLIDAIDDDILTSAKGTDIDGLANKAINNYRKNSEAITKLQDSVLGKIIGPQNLTPEKIAAKINKMDASEIRTVYSIFNGKAPDTIQQIKQSVLRNAMESAIGDPKKLATQLNFDPNKFIEKLPNRRALGAFFDQPGERKEVFDAVRALARLSDLSKGGGAKSVGSVTTDIAGVAASGSPIFGARLVATVGGPMGLTRALLTKEGRQALITLSQPIQGRDPAIINAAFQTLRSFNDGQ